MNSELTPLFDFIKFAAQLRQVYRNNNATAERKESVAEHSWHLALIAWVLHEAFEKEFAVKISQEDWAVGAKSGAFACCSTICALCLRRRSSSP